MYLFKSGMSLDFSRAILKVKLSNVKRCPQQRQSQVSPQQFFFSSLSDLFFSMSQVLSISESQQELFPKEKTSVPKPQVLLRINESNNMVLKCLILKLLINQS